MTIASILEELDAEIARLEQVKKLLRSVATGKLAPTGKGNANGTRRKKRKLSPEARQRIAEAQRKRWAAQKKAAK